MHTLTYTFAGCGLLADRGSKDVEVSTYDDVSSFTATILMSFGLNKEDRLVVHRPLTDSGGSKSPGPVVQLQSIFQSTSAYFRAVEHAVAKAEEEQGTLYGGDCDVPPHCYRTLLLQDRLAFVDVQPHDSGVRRAAGTALLLHGCCSEQASDGHGEGQTVGKQARPISTSSALEGSRSGKAATRPFQSKATAMIEELMPRSVSAAMSLRRHQRHHDLTYMAWGRADIACMQHVAGPRTDCTSNKTTSLTCRHGMWPSPTGHT